MHHNSQNVNTVYSSTAYAVLFFAYNLWEVFMNTNIFQQLVATSILLSTISCAFIQKTKGLFNTNKYLIIYSLIVNLVFSIIFCYSFTEIKLPRCLWTGLFSFIGADTIYKSLEGRLATHTKLRNKKKIINPQQ